MTATLHDFWPTEAHGIECLVSEAESADDAVFLAVHQPMRLTRIPHGVSHAEPEVRSEEDLLQALLIPEPPQGTLVVPIIGATGVGKSHMIRWLDAHLRLRPDSVRRHVVRIPKSASLRRVLELVLEGRQEPHYVVLRQKLTSARLPPDLLTATYNLQASLLVALERNHGAAIQRIRDRDPRPDDEAREAHCDSRGLRALLQDPQITEHFTRHVGENKGILARIAERFIQGSKQTGDSPTNLFQATDLDFTDDVEMDEVALVTKQYLLRLKQANGTHRAAAIKFLEEVKDSALGELVDFRGFSLAELFIEVRKQFLADGLELVLLVEDLAVLAGIQGSLLDAMIREGIRNGRRELCIMRTAFAVTEGYSGLHDTVLTRARAIWKIEARPFANEEEAFASYEDFLGSYLNAARWGRDALVRSFKERSEATGLRDWIPDFASEHEPNLSEDDQRVLAAFGRSPKHNHPFFPFNASMIHELVRHYLGEGETIKFDPRKFINLLLYDTLQPYRRLFIAGKFPPPSFHYFKTSLQERRVSDEIQKRASGDKARTEALVYFWGGRPQYVSDAAAVSSAIYEAFQLPPVPWNATSGHAETKNQSTPSPKFVPKKSEPLIEQESEDLLGPWKQILRGWRAEGILTQRDAATLRTWLAEAISDWLDWDLLMLRPARIQGSSIWLPKVIIGNPTIGKTVAIAFREEDWSDPVKLNQFFAALEGLARFQNSNRSWDYRQSESDATAYASLIEGLASQTVRYIQDQGLEHNPASVKPLAQALLLGARILNLPGAGSTSDNAALLAAIFAPVDKLLSDLIPSPDSWIRLQQGARIHRNALLEWLTSQVAARQGGGDPRAIDAARLLEAIEDLRPVWKLQTKTSDLLKGDPEVSRHLSDLGNPLERVAASRSEVLAKWHEGIASHLESTFNKVELVSEMTQTINEAKDAGLFRSRSGITPQALLKAVGDLGRSAFKEAFDLAATAATLELPLGERLSALAKVDPIVVELSSEVFLSYSDFERETAKLVAENLKDSPPNLDDASAELTSKLESLTHLWQEARPNIP